MGPPLPLLWGVGALGGPVETALAVIADGRLGHDLRMLTSSWNCPAVEGCDLSTVMPATAAFAAAGMLLVASAGNSGPHVTAVGG